jgi:F420-dependent oxidoreductase-like protein
MRFGLQLWSQQTSWPAFRDAALAAEGAGWDSIWTWDHLMAIFGPWEQPILEGWTVLAGLAPLTKRVRLGLMVGANTFRNPGHTAKLASTLDHLSDGRAVLGIGGAWFEREHDAYGIDFGSGFGERLDRLDEAVMLMRRLLDGERFSHDGRHYAMHDALLAPPPIQAHLPILVGGSGPRKTLRTVARRADGWNTSGTLDEVRTRLDILAEHCADVGRDIATIEKTVSFPTVLRDDPAAAEAAFAGQLEANGTDRGTSPVLLGSPAMAADTIRPYKEMGFETVIVRMPAPYDRETIERMASVRELLGE